MAKDQFFTAPVEGIAAGGDGIVRCRGRTFFMSFTAPGDRVVGRLSGEGDRAELVELEEASPRRTVPVCPLYGICGGCSLQHLSYEFQLEEKARILQEALRRIGKLETLPELKIVPSPPYEYRNRFEFHRLPGRTNAGLRRPLRRKVPAGPCRPGGGQAVGLKGRKSGVIVPVPDCPVADPAVRKALGEGRVRPPPEKDRFTVYGRGDLLLCGGETRRGTVSILGKGIRMDGTVFFQSNALMLEALIGDLSGLIGEMEDLPAADLYAGVGTFASFLGERFSRLDLLEENKQALALARENMENLARSRPLGGGTFRYFPMTDDRWVKTMEGKKTAYGFAAADPPRQGLSRAMAQWLARQGPPALAYISCNPAALARDSRELTAGGYRLDSLTLYDFYPQTAHIESLGIFKKDKP
ncbi:MAG: class I SAM-dependent RNA methyltransferase [Treponema sp.]|jgi:23S rRNA (uracil1939-C5)-methyltransferase|nr:class I SAM-dependent RNA methyltransferase [Treponema sp.]